MSEAPRLGPLARAALRRAIEAAVAAGRAKVPVRSDQHAQHAIQAIETAMVVDHAQVDTGAQDLH